MTRCSTISLSPFTNHTSPATCVRILIGCGARALPHASGSPHISRRCCVTGAIADGGRHQDIDIAWHRVHKRGTVFCASGLGGPQDTGEIMDVVTWTPERVERLTQLFEEGLPTAEIGRRLGLTKNAVIGKLHRIALAPRGGVPI